MGGMALFAAALIHGCAGKPSIFSPADTTDRPPNVWERWSIHVIVYAVWGIGFGAIVWRGVSERMIDVELPFERQWEVWQQLEWIYISVYFVPLVLPWLARSRAALRRYALDLWWLLGVCVVMYLLLPFASAPRSFSSRSVAGSLLAWETTRRDFAAAAFPSFHVCWAMLCARFLGSLGAIWKLAGWTWAAAVACSCVLTGAHALVDVVAAVITYLVVTLLTRERDQLSTADSARAPDLRPDR